MYACVCVTSHGPSQRMPGLIKSWMVPAVCAVSASCTQSLYSKGKQHYDRLTNGAGWMESSHHWFDFSSLSEQKPCLISSTKSRALPTQCEGSRPEWRISSMIYSRDTPFWSGTLDIITNKQRMKNGYHTQLLGKLSRGLD